MALLKRAILSWATFVVAALPINRTPILFAHDAATVYLDYPSINVIKKLEQNWAQTQINDGHGTAGLLDCGARGLDWRIELDKRKNLIFHHGSVEVPQTTVDAALDEVVSWAAQHAGELVLITVDGCTDNECAAELGTLLAKHHVSIVKDESLGWIDYATAIKQFALPSGGAVVVNAGARDENYDPSNVCRKGGLGADAAGLGTSGDRVAPNMSRSVASLEAGIHIESCVNGSSSQSIPYGRLFASLGGVRASDRLWAIQGLWQQSTNSVALGIASGSSILKDTEDSGLGWRLLHKLQSGELAAQSLNLLKIDAVCSGSGKALGDYVRLRRANSMGNIMFGNNDTRLYGTDIVV